MATDASLLPGFVDGISPAGQFGTVTLNNCEREAIHIPGAIQPHGALIAFESGAGSVLHASNNLSDFFTSKLLANMGFPLKDLIGVPAFVAIMEALSMRAGTGVRHQVVNLPARPQSGQDDDLEALVHSHRGICFIEFFRATSSLQQRDWLQEFDDTVDALRSSLDMDELLDRAANRIKRLTGFDRVMIYRFDAQWNGQVVAEALEPQLEPFHGLHFPATDIPPQARELYHKNLVRYIADVSYQPVPVYPLRNAVTQQPLDQSYVALRSISPMHIQYLKNMGVNSTITISILVNEKLWGLVSCHHHQPTQVPVRLQRACYSLAITMGYMVMAQEGKAKSKQLAEQAECQRRIMNAFNQPEVRFEDVIEHSAASLLKIGQATAGVFWSANAVVPFGRWRSGALGDALIAYARTQLHSLKEDLFFIDQLQIKPALSAADQRQASGMAAIRLDPFSESGILWLRPECRQSVHWGGDPYKSVTRSLDEKGQVYLTPRASFDRWEMVVSGRSLPWTETDQIALQMMGGLSEVLKVREALHRVSLSDRRFRSLLSLQSDAYWQLTDGGQLNVLSKVIAISDELIEGTSFIDLVQKHGDAKSFEGLRQALSLNRDFRNLPLVWTHANNAQSEFIMHGEPIRNTMGMVSGWHGTITDSTKSRRLEAEARRNWELLRGAIDALDEAFALYDPQDKLVYCNEKYKQIYTAVAHLMVPGARFEDLIRAGAESGQYLAAIGQVDAWVKERLATHLQGNTTLVERHTNGRTLRVVERKLADGHIVGFRIDITELVRATERADAANRSKSEFLANMSHEIRSPLNGILGMAYLLEQSSLAPHAQQIAHKISGSGRMLLSLISDILDGSKIEAGQMVLERGPFDLEAVVDSVASSLGLAIGDKDIEPVVSPLPAGVRTIIGDAMRLQQVLMNFVSNAAKFTQTGCIELRIELSGRTEDIEWLRFSVHDTGIGIALAQQSSVFDAFTQADSSTTRRFGGTGLGLTISRQLVGMMGGEVGLSSVLGQGSEFWFTLPLQRIEAVQQAQETALSLTELEVLVVDDSGVALQALGTVVQSLGWRTNKLDSGAAALAHLFANQGGKRPDVVILDWNMPGMDGLAVARAIRARADLNACPIVIIANAGSLPALASEDGAGVADAILSKPVTASALQHAVLQAQRHRSGTQDSSTAVIRKKQDLLAGVRVLVVDDVDINREVAQNILVLQGATVTLAVDGQQAIDWLLAHTFDVDLVLMDLQMPVLDGLEATRQLRRLPEFDDLPIVALTAGAFKSQQEEALAAGITAFVSKPFDVVLTVDLIRRLHRPARGSGATSMAAAAQAEMPARTASAPAGVMDPARGLALWTELTKYQFYLRRFAGNYSDAVETMRAHLVNGDRPAAAALAHKLSGAAVNLALPDTHHAAQEVVRVLGTQADPKSELANLNQALVAVLEEIARYAPPIKPAARTFGDV